MRERNERGVFIDGGFECGNIGCDVVVACADQSYLVAVAQYLFDALQDIQIRGKVERVGDDARFIWLQRERRCGEFDVLAGKTITSLSVKISCL